MIKLMEAKRSADRDQMEADNGETWRSRATGSFVGAAVLASTISGKGGS